jgi:hypothetical protein
MRAREFLLEAKLQPAEIFKNKEWRAAALIQKLQDQTPFVDSLSADAKSYAPADGEYERLSQIILATKEALAAAAGDAEALQNVKLPSLVLNYKSITLPDGTVEETPGAIPFNKLEKADLQKPSGKVASPVNVQPGGIKITAEKPAAGTSSGDEIKHAIANKAAIAGKDLHKIIANNEVLEQAGELGKAIKEASASISQGQTPDLSRYDKSIQTKIAVDAGEYLGLQQMVDGLAKWSGNKYEKFLAFLDAPDLNNMLFIFPGSQNSQLSDCYGVQNTQTGHTILISAKGGTGSNASGAAPSLRGLVLPPSLTKNITPGGGVDFIKAMQKTSTVFQPFVGMNFLYEHYPESVPDLYKSILPFTESDMQAIKLNIDKKGDLDPKYDAIVESIDAKGTRGGILYYATVKDLVDIINSTEPIPDFRQTILEILDMNFVQIFSRVVGGKLTADVLWPGKIDGQVQLWSKAYASEPAKNGLGFKVT